MDNPDQPATSTPPDAAETVEWEQIPEDRPASTGHPEDDTRPHVAAGRQDDDGRDAMRWIAAGSDLEQFMANVDRLLEEQGFVYRLRARSLHVALDMLANVVPNVQAGDCIAQSLMNLAKVARDADL